MAERDPHAEEPGHESSGGADRDGSPHDETDAPAARPGDTAFDDIVRGLQMDWDDPGLVRPPAPEPDPELPPELDEQPDPVDEQFYRQVPQGPTRPLERGKVLAWCGVLGTPAVLAVCTLFGVWLSGPVLLTAGLTVVAGAIYLISQLPERGPSHPDWPDDGAVL